MTRKPIKERIIEALRANHGRMVYHTLARAVFPKEQYPRAFDRPNRGGPPGCYMVLSRAIREHGFNMQFEEGYGVTYSIVSLGKNR